MGDYQPLIANKSCICRLNSTYVRLAEYFNVNGIIHENNK